MRNHTQPLLTIGIIFKDEIRCLKRCLEALVPLRKAVSCELIMADTGSADGSREIAAHYADILFDFPWVNDFSAARNAVMDRASGQWYLTIDADEYLDENISELTAFLKTTGKNREQLGGVLIRNYETTEMDSKYSDFLAVRLVSMSTGLRYRGTIHEAWPFEEMGLQEVRALSNTILHHDGYVELDDDHGEKKRERNLTLLREMLAQNPKDLRRLLQYIESGRDEDDYLQILNQAMTIVKERPNGWQKYGPPIFRYAVKVALEKELTEFWEWTSQAQTLFPDSFFTRIDIEYLAFTQALKEGDFAGSIRRGEYCLRAIKEFQEDEDSLETIVFSVLLMSSPYWEQSLRIYLADVYTKEGNPKRAWELLQNIDGTLLDAQLTGNMLCALGDLHRLSYMDTAPMIQKLFQDIPMPVPSEKAAQKRREVFLQAGALAFLMQTQKAEQLERNFCRPSYMLFLPLADQCDIGRGAVILASENTEEMRHVLAEVEDWNQLPIESLSHALEQGVVFPLSEKPLELEDIDRLVGRLAEDKESFYRILKQISKEDLTGNYQRLAWVSKLILTGIQGYDWDSENSNTSMGIELAKLFAKVEEVFLSRYYQSETLCEKNHLILPALHRFGWHCARAFKALEAGNPTEYVRELRAGLHTCKAMEPMVEWLMEHTLALHSKEVSSELLALAEQVRTFLAAYSPESLAVKELKASPVYQKVAWLIEDNEI